MTDIVKVEALTKSLKEKRAKSDTVLAFLDTPEICERIVEAAMTAAQECAKAEKFVDLTVEYETSARGSTIEEQSKHALIGVRKRVQASAEAAAVVAVDAVVAASGVIATCAKDMGQTENDRHLLKVADKVIASAKAKAETPEPDINARTRNDILRELPGGAA